MNNHFDISKVTRCIFRSVTFAYQVFYRVRFIECKFIDCTFDEDTVFQECNFRDSDFSDQDLNNVKFIDCDLRNVYFIDSKMENTVLDKSHIYLEDFEHFDEDTNDTPDLKNAIIHDWTEEDYKQVILDFWEFEN